MKKNVAVVVLFFLATNLSFGQTCDLEFGVHNDFDDTRNVNDRAVYACSSIPIKLTADNINNANYTWFLDNEKIDSVKTNTLEINGIAGSYKVLAEIGNCRYERTFIAILSAQIETRITNTNPQTICNKGGYVELYAYPYDKNQISYQWQKNQKDIDGATNSSYRAASEGVYTARVAQGECKTTTQPITVLEEDIKTQSIYVGENLFTKDSTIEVCNGSSIRILAQYGIANYSDFKLFKDDKVFSYNRDNSVSETGKYRIELKKGECQLKSPTVELKFGNSIPNFTIGNMNERNFGECGIQRLYLNSNIYQFIDSNYRLEWKKEGVKVDELPFGYFFTANEIRKYTAVLTNGTCSKESDVYEIKSLGSQIIPLRVNGIPDKKVDVCYGQGLRIQLALSTKADMIINLYRDGDLVISSSKPNEKDYYIEKSGKYYLLYQQGDNCVGYSDTLEVNIQDKISTKITLDPTECSTGLYKMSVENKDGLTYSWKKDGKILENTNSPTYTTKEFGNYSVVINKNYCSVSSPEVKVGIKINTVESICENQVLELNVSKGRSYQWFGPNGFYSDKQNPEIIRISKSEEGIYKSKVTDYNGCSFTDSVFIKVDLSPVFSVTTSEVNCVGGSLTFSMNTVENSISYLIFAPDDELVNVANKWIRGNLASEMAGVYTITAIDQNSNCRTEVKKEIEISTTDDCPFVEFGDFSGLSLCYGSEVEIPFVVRGSFKENTIFTINSVDSQGNLTALNSGTNSPIKVNLTSSTLVITTNDRKIQSLVKNDLLITFVAPPSISYDNAYACTGYKVNLKVDSIYNGQKFDSFQWKVNGIEIPNATQREFDAAISGEYSVDVFYNGCISFKPRQSKVNVTIGELTSPRIYTIGTPFACQGYNVELLSNNHPEDATFEWKKDNNTIENGNFPQFKAFESGSYSLTVRQGDCEASSTNLEVYLVDAIPVEIAGFGQLGFSYNENISLCKKTNYNLIYLPYLFNRDTRDSNAIKNDLKFQWQKDGYDIPDADNYAYEVTSNGSYRLVLSQGDCIAFSKDFTVTFSNEIKLSLINLSNLDHFYNTGSESACSGDSILLGTSNSFQPRVWISSQVYKGDSFIKELGANSNNFFVSKSGSYWIKQEYRIENSEEVCVGTSDTLNIKIGGSIIEVESTDQRTTTCADTIQLYDRFLNNAKYKWKFNGNYLENDTLSSIKVSQSGSYSREAYTKNCQYNTKERDIKFGELDVSIGSTFTDVPCYGETGSLNAAINSFDPKVSDEDPNSFKYQWKKDGEEYSNNYSLNYVQEGTYTLTLKQRECSATTDPITIKFNKISRDIFPVDSAFICTQNNFVTLRSLEENADSYIWKNNNLVVSEQSSPQFNTVGEGMFQAQIESGDCSTLSFPVIVSQKQVLPTAQISGDQELSLGDAAVLKFDFTSSGPWDINLTNGDSFIADTNPFEVKVNPSQSTIYELSSVTNSCGEGTVSGKAEIRIIVLATENSENSLISLYPVPTTEACQLNVQSIFPESVFWQLTSLDGKVLSISSKSQEAKNHELFISLGDYPNGVYFLKIMVGNNTYYRKIVKLN